MSENTTTTAAAKPVMQVRIDAAVKRLGTKVGQRDAAANGIVIVSCPKPKSATGTADRVRKELASGRLTGLPTGYVVKSKSNHVVVTVAANFHPWDRDAIAARKAETAKPTKSVKKPAAAKAAKPAAAKPRVRRRAKATA